MHHYKIFFMALLALAVGTQAICEADNCYRAMYPCRSGLESAWSSAYGFCSTVTPISSSTTATNYPAHATKACGASSPSKYLSVCSCGPTCAPKPPSCTDAPSKPAGAIYYNDLECTAPRVEVFDPTIRWGLLPGGFTGERALEVWLVGLWNETYSLWAHFDDIAIQKNVPVRLTFNALFSGVDHGNIRVWIDGAYRGWVNPPFPPQHWIDATFDFTPKENRVSFAIGVGFTSEIGRTKIDNVRLQYLH